MPNKGSSTGRRPGTAATAILALLALALCIGCDASGYPAFVKLSPEGRFVVYQDGRYPKTYVYDTRDGRKAVFDGRAACMNEKVSQLVLRGSPRDEEMSCRLLTFDADGVHVRDLPAMPTAGYREARVVFVGEGADLLALLYESSWADRPGRALRLAPGRSQWEEVPIPSARADQPLWAIHEPAGARLTGHVFSPRDRSFRLPEDEYRGLDVELAFDNHDPCYVLRSPGGQYTVTIRDPDDPWRRLWLTRADGTRVLLLDQNDMPGRIAGAVISFPGAMLLALFCPNI